ncbi:DUF2065 family protein [Flavobacterium sp. MXW15]|uniref:DUF2065 family protein n=1 Tax=Xanthomonas chitinilytica TaxID=2989819 RepID=A0ABT3JVC1_9XANT|nr:DUF2065 family protein [Xanthomonas sp. H13-6]MCW4454934.1 DUF2065 family protein [Flavobacterium sp. MXW15]MCW4472439.1 DUF2065 family protein [Xanthomonas sp. H13-6]
MQDLLVALCLVAVLEGLLLFAAPQAWKRMAEQLLAMPLPVLRRIGAVTLGAGLLALWLLRH